MDFKASYSSLGKMTPVLFSPPHGPSVNLLSWFSLFLAGHCCNISLALIDQ